MTGRTVAAVLVAVPAVWVAGWCLVAWNREAIDGYHYRKAPRR